MKKKLSWPLILLICLISITVVLCASVFFIWNSGRNAITAQVEAPSLPQPIQEETQPETVQPPKDAVLYRGKYYRYNEHICSILLLGIDSKNKPDSPLSSGNDNQSDVVILAALDMKNKKVTLISLNRDTMCDFPIPDENGDLTGTAHAQLALAYSFGDGLEKSCELTCEAVSNLFYGLHIHGYAAYYMSGIPVLNDALGGVTLTVSEDYPFYKRFAEMEPGSTVTLTGKMADAYIRSRHSTEEGNLQRMQRQKQYILALMQQAKSKMKSDLGTVPALYHAVEEYMVTDLTLSKVSYLASRAIDMSFSGELIQPEGELILGNENHMELTLDQESLYEMILNIFYEEIPSNS